MNCYNSQVLGKPHLKFRGLILHRKERNIFICKIKKRNSWYKLTCSDQRPTLSLGCIWETLIPTSVISPWDSSKPSGPQLVYKTSLSKSEQALPPGRRSLQAQSCAFLRRGCPQQPPPGGMALPLVVALLNPWCGLRVRGCFAAAQSWPVLSWVASWLYYY